MHRSLKPNNSGQHRGPPPVKMTVEDLKRILNSVKDDTAAVFIEYSPAQYEYITEYVTGVRYSDDGKLTILGITNHLSDE